ncbi:hypothetical protein QFZ36_002383 [Pseudarthrobacter siccitolerans]|uniref:Uncharacterized protein n=1 Tax=Pseudarthrobacter siccitolerans TaxID=861266 RepID=A0ABU0PML9_9MICC|nr:hypothetical protein [Pseudarthrobacter siccitolerans]MDQ0674822.1 hypothetical protein [Pseudarthrobacter siccitolerans]
MPASCCDPFRLRHASPAHLPAIVRLLPDDALGSGRERTVDMAPYELAFQAIDADHSHLLVMKLTLNA